MVDRILFPTDGSEGTAVALELVLDMARTYDATVHVLNVADTSVHSVTRVGGEVVDTLERTGEEIVDDVAATAADRGVSTVTEVLQGGVPETITRYADERGMDLVVMPTRGRTGLNQLLLGSVTERVLRTSSTPVLTVNPDVDHLRYPYETILAPTDGSDTADEAVEVASDIAADHGAKLHLLSVIAVKRLGVDVHSGVQADSLEARAEEVIDEATALARAASVESVEGVVEYSSAVHRAVRSYVDEHEVDLVVVGTQGRSGLDRYLLGSVAEKVVRTAPVPVLTVPGNSSAR